MQELEESKRQVYEERYGKAKRIDLVRAVKRDIADERETPALTPD